MLKLKMAKTFPKNGAVETKKTGFFFSNGKFMRAAIAHGIKHQLLLDAFEEHEEPNLHQLFIEFNIYAKECKAVCIVIHGNALFYAFNHNCGFSIFSADGKLKYQTPNNKGFGTFSGRQNYERYITNGVIAIEKGDTIVLYNGNVDKIVKSSNFYKSLKDKTCEKIIDFLIEQDHDRPEQGIIIFTLE